MKIRNSNSATSAIHDSDVMDDDYRVEFNDDDEATVREDVGTALAEKYPGIEAVEDPSPPPDSDDSADSDGADEQADDSDTEGDNE